MRWVLLEMKGTSFLSQSEQPYVLSEPPPSPVNFQSGEFNLNDKVSPSVLLIIIILAIIFFVSGLLHLLVRFLLRTPTREPEDVDNNATAFQGQLQQLFHLHDGGVDQSFIDTLPVFNYKSIIGGKKNPFDCAVCLCEFESEDKLRLLPKCSHAFHMECIDTWLLSHSTCPLCRASLLPDFIPNSCSPIVLVLESGSESSREIVADREANLGAGRANSHLGALFDEEIKFSRREISRKSCEIQVIEEENRPGEEMAGAEEKVVTVKLGKFRSVDGGGEESSNKNVDERRCFSMGSFAYVMDENTCLQVPIRTPMKKQSSKKPSLPLIPGHQPAMSEYGCDSSREFNGFEAFTTIDSQDSNRNALGTSKRESFSAIKMSIRGKKEKPNPRAEDPTRRAVSFRFPIHRSVAAAEEEDGKAKIGSGVISRRTMSEIDMRRLEAGGGSEFCCDVETESCNDSLDSPANPPSFAQKTLLWLTGRQNKVVHSSFSPNP